MKQTNKKERKKTNAELIRKQKIDPFATKTRSPYKKKHTHTNTQYDEISKKSHENNKNQFE